MVGDGGGVKLPLVEDSLELCWKRDIWYINTHTHIVSENVHSSTKTPIILLISAFFLQKSAFFGKNSTFTQSNSMRVVLEIFQFGFQVLQDKRLLLLKI